MGFAEVLGLFSGNEADAQHEKLLFNSVIGFRGIVDGVGTSTILASLAIALSERTNKRICVVDTNILYPLLFVIKILPLKAYTLSFILSKPMPVLSLLSPLFPLPLSSTSN